MSKLSASLKALISAPYARPNTLPAPSQIRSVYERLRQEASSKNVGRDSWLTFSTAATMTMNSAESLTVLFNLATTETDKPQAVQTAELMREVGLKCIGFNGVPRTINCLGAFKANLPTEIAASLSTKPTRNTTPQNLPAMLTRGKNLWSSVYRPFDAKLFSKLADSHPDLPVFIVNHEYGALFSDPERMPQGKVGRVLTSVAAVACLRAQTGVGPQVTSHVFGLRKAFEDGSWEAEGEKREDGEGARWLASDEGNVWLLESVDAIVECLGEGMGSSFAPGMVRTKL